MNPIPLGGKFRLKKTVTKSDLENLDYYGPVLSWILSQDYFVKSIDRYTEKYHPNKIYYDNNYYNRSCYFDIDMVEPLEIKKKERNHLLTNMFK